MLVKTILTTEDLREEFISMNRDYYSYYGYEALIDLFEECDNGQPTELDVIAICCDFEESYPADIAEDYGIDLSDITSKYDQTAEEYTEEEQEEITERVMEFINENTIGILLKNGFILYQKF